MGEDRGDWADIYPERPVETRSIAQRLGSIFRDHGPDPADPEHGCVCGYHGDNYVGHLTRTVLVDLKDLGWEVRPIRY